MMSFLVYGKIEELGGSKNIFSLSNKKRDAAIKKHWRSFIFNITHVSMKSIKKGSHKVITSAEGAFLKVMSQLGKKFSSIGDMVRGKDIPRNRGSVSFFLKNISEHKKSWN